jgi:hypothetical protein
LNGAVGQAHAERLDGGRHCIRGVHTSAGAGTRDGAGFDFLQADVVDLARGMLARWPNPK